MAKVFWASLPQARGHAELRRHPVSRAISFAWTPIERICEASGVDVQIFSAGDENNVAGLIVARYVIHRQHGGAPNAVAEQLFAEVDAEDRYGEISVQPGGSGEPQ